MVLQMVIDDGDSTRIRRTELFNPVNVQVGLSWASHSLYGMSTVIDYGREGYVTKEPWSYCGSKISAELAPDGATGLLLASVLHLSLLVSLLFCC